MDKVRPVIIQKLDSLDSDYKQEFKDSIEDSALFWATYGYFYETLDPIVLHTNSIDLTAYDPWNDVYPFLKNTGLLNGNKYVVLLEDWDREDSVGVGGNPVAVISGGYCIPKLKSAGTPQYVWDDNLVRGLIAHEIGHLYGMGHDWEVYARAFENVMLSVMGYGWMNYPNYITLRNDWIKHPGPTVLYSVLRTMRLYGVGTGKLGKMSEPCPRIRSI